MNRLVHVSRQAGLTYVEVMIAVVLLALALVPAVDALHSGVLGRQVLETTSSEHYAVLSLMEEVLAEPFAMLTSAAATAGDQSTPTSFSDAAGPPDRRLVFIALYDANDADGDGDAFTVADPDLDGDGDPYTGYSSLLWIRAEVEGSVTSLESLVAP